MIRFPHLCFIMSPLREHSGRQRQRHDLLGQLQSPPYKLLMDLLDKSHGNHGLTSGSLWVQHAQLACVRILFL